MTVGLALGAPAAGNDVAWATNALKQLERFLKAQSAATSFYNNSGSGLDSKNVQDAIDELEAAFVAAIALLQPLDATLTALAALDSSAGFVYQTGADAFSKIGLKGYLYGLTLSNGTDAVNDIDIAVGAAADANGLIMTLASGLTKRLDASWAVGTNQGGLDTGAIANTTYHLWLIQRSDTGVVDVLFSASATAPTMPTSYDRKRRIGSILRVGATILGFTQVGDEFLLNAPVNDVAVVNLSTSSVSYPLTVPIGIKVIAILNGYFTNGTVSKLAYIRSLDQTDAAAAIPYYTVQNAVAAKAEIWSKNIRTDTSGQIAARADAASSTFGVMTNGWFDSRGRLA